MSLSLCIGGMSGLCLIKSLSFRAPIIFGVPYFPATKEGFGDGVN